MTGHEERKQVVALLNESKASGVRQAQACDVLGLSERTLQRWQAGGAVHCDQRPLRDYRPPHKLTETERAKVLAVANSAEFGHLPPSQIVPPRTAIDDEAPKPSASGFLAPAPVSGSIRVTSPRPVTDLRPAVRTVPGGGRGRSRRPRGDA